MTKKEVLVGAHTSAAGGVHNALLEGQRIGATTIQLFTSNQRQWKGKVLSNAEIDLWDKTIKETGLKKIMSHDSYLINLGSCNPELLKKSRQAFEEEAQRCIQLGISFLNFHPGAAVGCDAQQCLDVICESLKEMEPIISKGKTRLLLEMTAGQGTAVGYSFEQISYLLERVKNVLPIGVCIDTCHIFAAGYDIRTSKGWDAVLKEFDRIVGLKHLYALHLNDSSKPLGSRVDRHAQLGDGHIGLDCFKFLMTDPRTRDLPQYLETPGGPAFWEKEIQLLKEFAERK
jgi:deoxyribonuclease-4